MRNSKGAFMVRPRKSRPAEPARRMVAEFSGDRAVDVQRLQAEIGVSGRSQQARDQEFVDIALLALIYVIQQVRRELACNYPCTTEIAKFISESLDQPATPYSVLTQVDAIDKVPA